MKRRIPTLFFLFLLTLVLTVSADYRYTGYNNNVADNTLFTNGLVATQQYDAYSNPMYNALIGDLTGDGVQEIVTIYKPGTYTGFRVYNSTDNNLITSYINGTLIYGSQPILMDYDGDGDVEIAIAEEGGSDQARLYIFDWNGSAWTGTDKGQFSGSSGGAIFPILLGCSLANPFNCIMVQYDGDYLNGIVNAWSWNRSDGAQGTKYEVFKDTISHSMPCPPNNGKIWVGDVDADVSTQEFIFTYYIHGQGNTDDGADIWILQVDAQGDISVLNNINTNIGDITNDAGASCGSIGGRTKISNPYVADIDGKSWNGKEIVFTSADSVPTKFNLKYAKWNSATKDDTFPELFSREGDVIFSNVVEIDVFPDTGTVDFCGGAYDTVNNLVNIVCASKIQTALLVESNNYQIAVAPGVPDATTLRFGNDLFSATLNGNDVLFTTYGTYTVPTPTNSGTKTLTLDYGIDASNGTITVSDVEGSGYSDLYVVTPTNLVFYDDNQFNRGCDDVSCIRNITIDPSNLQTWKNGTDVEISVLGIDTDGDKLSIRVTLYANNSNSQTTGWIGNYTSGTTFSGFLYVANTTIINGKILFEARDVENYNDIERYEEPFSVGLSGISKGDSKRIIDRSDPGASDPTTTTTDDDDIVENAVQSIVEESGFSKAMIWVILMIIVGIGMWYVSSYNNKLDGTTTIGVIGFVEAGLLILGNIWGFIGFGTLLIFIIISVAIISLLFRSMVMGAGS